MSICVMYSEWAEPVQISAIINKFINAYGINVELYKNEDDFLEKNLKPLVKEN